MTSFPTPDLMARAEFISAAAKSAPGARLSFHELDTALTGVEAAQRPSQIHVVNDIPRTDGPVRSLVRCSVPECPSCKQG